MTKQPDDWQSGAVEFNAGRWFEAHHGWESAWKRLDSAPERAHAQSLILVCGILMHCQKGRGDAARRLAILASEKQAEGVGAQNPVDIPGAREWIRGALVELQRTDPDLRALVVDGLRLRAVVRKEHSCRT